MTEQHIPVISKWFSDINPKTNVKDLPVYNENLDYICQTTELIK